MGAFSFSTIHFPPYNCGTRYNENDQDNHWDDSNDDEAWHDDLDDEKDWEDDENSFCLLRCSADLALCDDA